MMTSETALKWSIETDAQRNWHIIEEDSIGPTLIESLQEAVDMVEASEPLAWHDMNQIEQMIDSRAEYNHPDADPVERPAHYNNGGIECIDYLKDNMSWEGYTGYLEGNCKKYLHRWRYKAKPLEDLKKARWYLDRLIGELEGPDEP